MIVYTITERRDKYIDGEYSKIESFNLGVYASIDLARAAVYEDIRFTFNIDKDMNLKAIDNFKIWKLNHPNEETIFVSNITYWGYKDCRISYTITAKDFENILDDNQDTKLTINEENPITTDEKESYEDKENVYVYCRKNYSLQLNLDTINELIDEIITAIELGSKTRETTLLGVYKYRDTAYLAMFDEYKSHMEEINNHISGSRSKEYEYDIRYLYSIDSGELFVYIVYSKEII